MNADINCPVSVKSTFAATQQFYLITSYGHNSTAWPQATVDVPSYQTIDVYESCSHIRISHASTYYIEECTIEQILVQKHLATQSHYLAMISVIGDGIGIGIREALGSSSPVSSLPGSAWSSKSPRLCICLQGGCLDHRRWLLQPSHSHPWTSIYSPTALYTYTSIHQLSMYTFNKGLLIDVNARGWKSLD